MQRKLKEVDVEQYWEYIVEFNENHVLPIGPIDELRARYWPEISDRTALTLLFIINRIYEELAYRYMEGK
jgi:hypothetical protein